MASRRARRASDILELRREKSFGGMDNSSNNLSGMLSTVQHVNMGLLTCVLM